MQQALLWRYRHYTVNWLTVDLFIKLLLAGTAYSIKVLNNYKGVK